ncbi:HEPN domain-containing protein [Dyadobacter chenwenxiniae]|uniref:HEPN domain-containing protein n=1 Tax=Dyadobacter chenwenxiniae TaxID=2906456 RepID=A0A9X1PLU7_9BACT|nr:HEPN domain-containing protein [Dyadobacter chenwenxiniae]MCF0062309.1 HEPN domain-containing protein [Dyadobacter chenwenxiniae]UON83935.1 HEPN domain-containing protein [Dyadobacter chenwenxiniae]
MATLTELKTLALIRLKEAQALYNNGYYEGAYYVGGYAVELGLKAAICKNLNVNIFDRKEVSGSCLKAFLTHDLSDLTVLAGLKPELNILIKEINSFNITWSIVSDWNEQRRYQSGCPGQKAKIFLDSVNIVMIWIKQHW